MDTWLTLVISKNGLLWLASFVKSCCDSVSRPHAVRLRSKNDLRPVLSRPRFVDRSTANLVLQTFPRTVHFVHVRLRFDWKITSGFIESMAWKVWIVSDFSLWEIILLSVFCPFISPCFVVQLMVVFQDIADAAYIRMHRKPGSMNVSLGTVIADLLFSLLIQSLFLCQVKQLHCYSPNYLWQRYFLGTNCIRSSDSVRCSDPIRISY